MFARANSGKDGTEIAASGVKTIHLQKRRIQMRGNPGFAGVPVVRNHAHVSGTGNGIEFNLQFGEAGREGK